MNKVYSVNKKARFDYEILDTLEAGLVLTGAEVKSIRAGSVSLNGGFIVFHDNNAELINVHIPKYKFAGSLKNYEPERTRRLLLKDREINYLRGKSQERGLTIVPLSLYNKGRHIKLEIAVAKGKKKYDKREATKKRELNREINKKIKENY
jgi:SsrA-binding protein